MSKKLLPLEALLLLSLLADLRKLPFIVLPCPALLGFASGVVLHSLDLLLPRFHQLVVALTDLLFLCAQQEKPILFLPFFSDCEVKKIYIPEL